MEELKERELESIDINISMPWGYVVGRWYGNRNVRPILALHGWLDNMGTWNNLLPLLPTHIGILCIDLPGHGKSSMLPNGIIYSGWNYIYVVLQIMKDYNWQKVSLLTHSMSSMNSFIFASIYPHKVDLFISIDIVRPKYFQPNQEIHVYRERFEKFGIEEERMEKSILNEPPSYTYEQLQKLQYEGSGRSVDLVNCKHILERNIARSQLYPDKYYFSRDARLKHYIEITMNHSLTAKLAQRLHSVPYCVIKGSDSNFINVDSAETIDILRNINPYFEIHELHGTHHVHLNDAQSVAAIIKPFINRYRPPLVNAWTIDKDNDEKINIQSNMRKQIKKQNWNWLKWKSKL